MKTTMILLAMLCAGCNYAARDDSDMPDGRVSGMRVYKDARTGCQYLSGGGSTLTPRMNLDGKQLCEVKP